MSNDQVAAPRIHLTKKQLVCYLQTHAWFWFMICLFFLGIGGASFAIYTLWLPEQYRTEVSRQCICVFNLNRTLCRRGITFLVGAGVSHFHTIGTPVALTSLAFIVGLLLLPFGKETKGESLPA